MQWYLERTPVHIGDAINKTLEIVEKDQDPFYGIPSGFMSLDRLPLIRHWRLLRRIRIRSTESRPDSCLWIDLPKVGNRESLL